MNVTKHGGYHTLTQWFLIIYYVMRPLEDRNVSTRTPRELKYYRKPHNVHVFHLYKPLGELLPPSDWRLVYRSSIRAVCHIPLFENQKTLNVI